MGDDVGLKSHGPEAHHQHGHYDKTAANAEQPSQHASKRAKQQITHKQHKHSFPRQRSGPKANTRIKKEMALGPSLHCAG